MRMLIAEDDRLTADTLSRRLQQEHYAVDVCYRGDDALDYLLDTDYDVAVLDIMMPGMDGIEVLRRARNAGRTTPVLLLTARDAISDRVRRTLRTSASADPAYPSDDQPVHRRRPDGGLRRTYRSARRRSIHSHQPGIFAAGIPDPQQRAFTLPYTNHRKCMEL